MIIQAACPAAHDEGIEDSMRKPGRPGEAAGAPNRESRAGNDSEMSRLRRAEQALSAAEDFNRAILDAVSAQVAVLDEAGNIIAVNRPWRQFAIENSGSPGQAAPRTDVGTNYLDVCRAAQGQGAAGAMQVHDGILAVLERRIERFSYDYPCHAPHQKRWFQLTATALAGRRSGAVVSHTDISAPMELSERLTVTHARLALAQESAGAGVWDWDMQSGKLAWSDELFRLFGLDPAATRASFEAWRGILHPEDALAAEQRVFAAMASQQPLSSEYRILLPDARVRWIHALGKTTHDDAGKAVRMSGICLDVTSRKEAEQQLFETSQRLQALMEALPVGVSFSDDRECHHITGNPALLAQFEVSPEDNVSASAPDPLAAGRRVRYLKDGRELSDTELPLQRAAAEGRPMAPVELEVHLPSGRHWFAEVSGAPLHDAQGQVTGGVAVVVDVTKRKEAEEALREADRRKDEFLAMLAHELRNPLTPIRNAVHIMGSIDLPDARLNWLREIIEQQVIQLARLVDDLLDVSRIVRGKIRLQKSAIDLAALIRQAVTAVQPALEAKTLSLSVQLPEAPVILDADPARVTQILVNLLDNSAKFTSDGGHIELTAHLTGGDIEICVRDDGCGIPPALLPHVFDLFQQGEEGLDRPSGGLGIGLTLVQRLARLHGGYAEASSEGPGRGSTFTVRLPANRPSTPMAAAPTVEHAREAPRSRVLVVDDDAAVADSTGLWLEMEGYDTRVARSGPAAMEEAQQFEPHIVLLDIGLSGMDGYEVAQRLRDLPGGDAMFLVAVTGYGHDEAVARTRAAGFDHHLVKPFDPRKLLTLLATRARR
jgi:PAS domain S-box-containing protein